MGETFDASQMYARRAATRVWHWHSSCNALSLTGRVAELARIQVAGAYLL